MQNSEIIFWLLWLVSGVCVSVKNASRTPHRICQPHARMQLRILQFIHQFRRNHRVDSNKSLIEFTCRWTDGTAVALHLFDATGLAQFTHSRTFRLTDRALNWLELNFALFYHIFFFEFKWTSERDPQRAKEKTEIKLNKFEMTTSKRFDFVSVYWTASTTTDRNFHLQFEV